MKNFLILCFLICVCSTAIAQKYQPVSKDFKNQTNFKMFQSFEALQKSFKSVKTSKSLSVQAKQRLASFLNLNTNNGEEEDCTPPPCDGTIDPWTCECYKDKTSEIRDPWEDDKKAETQKASKSSQYPYKSANGEAKMKQLEAILPAAMVSNAKNKAPGYSMGAMMERAELYLKALQ